MTDKQIMIDGVDVSGCEFYCDGCCTEITDSYGDYVDKCTEYNNCYYKQLKRTESELACKEQKLAKIKEYCKPRVMLNGTAYVILQIIEGKENG